MSVFSRTVDIKALKDKPIADYEPEELAAYLLHSYPNDPLGALKVYRSNLEVGYVLGEKTKLLLEGYV